MKPVYDEYGRVHYELPTLDATTRGLINATIRASKRMQRMLTRPRVVRRVK